MNGLGVVAIALGVAGALALAYGGFPAPGRTRR